MDKVKIAIAGAGLAGAACAYALTRRGVSDILILEKELVPGMHSSSRNASMIRQLVPEHDIAKLAIRGAKFFREQFVASENPIPYFMNGSLIVTDEKNIDDLTKLAEELSAFGLEFQVWDRAAIQREIPFSADGDFAGGIYCPWDGVTDAEKLLHSLLASARESGAHLVSSQEIERIDVTNGRLEGIKTTNRYIETEILINAAGPWAGRLADIAGAVNVNMKPYRRHLYYTGKLDKVNSNWPYIWDVNRDVYFRPESGGLLMSPCDETLAEPAIPLVDDSVKDLLTQKLNGSFPRLLDLPIRNCWAGLRTFTPDRKFVIGEDPYVKGFYWAAGLGGHGVTTCVAVGETLADEICSPRESKTVFTPERFL